MGVFLLGEHLAQAEECGPEEKAGLIGRAEAEGAARLGGRCLCCFLHSLRFFDGKVYILISFFDEGRNTNPKPTSLQPSPPTTLINLLNHQPQNPSLPSLFLFDAFE